MNIKRPLTRNERFILLALVPVYFIAAGFLLQPAGDIFEGVRAIIKEPDFLITDYFVIGGVGAAFLNAGILTLLSIAILYFLGMEMDGHTITSTFLMFGFSLFGKNLLNIWMILAGVWLYAKYHRVSLSKYIYVGFYGTSLSPIITEVMQIGDFSFPQRLLLHMHFMHRGYSLYNVGFAGGIIATVLVSLMKSFGITMESRLIWYEGDNLPFVILLAVLFLGMILGGFLYGGNMAFLRYQQILRSYGLGGTDYYKEWGAPATMINMGINGLTAMGFLIATGVHLNGPTIGGIFTIVGFSATGKHLRNILPVMTGVVFASAGKVWSLTDPSATLALLLSTTLAPIAGEFGIFAGILAGFLHSSVALNVGIVYGGMNLYNNGFAGGIVAAFLVPVIQSVRSRRARAKSGWSL